MTDMRARWQEPETPFGVEGRVHALTAHDVKPCSDGVFHYWAAETDCGIAITGPVECMGEEEPITCALCEINVAAGDAWQQRTSKPTPVLAGGGM